jgi:uncharacterized OB-fold protein
MNSLEVTKLSMSIEECAGYECPDCGGRVHPFTDICMECGWDASEDENECFECDQYDECHSNSKDSS